MAVVLDLFETPRLACAGIDPGLCSTAMQAVARFQPLSTKQWRVVLMSPDQQGNCTTGYSEACSFVLKIRIEWADFSVADYKLWHGFYARWMLLPPNVIPDL
jgi:hypothetical protein